jgi:hypothetical protein
MDRSRLSNPQASHHPSRSESNRGKEQAKAKTKEQQKPFWL